MNSPSTRRRSRPEKKFGINLVPMLDAMVTIIAFLLYSMSFLAMVSIESPAPVTSTAENRKIKQRPLQLTLSFKKDSLELWSPFNRIRSARIPFTPDGKPDVESLHEAVMGIKQKFPREKDIVLVPHNGVDYETLFMVMDSVRRFTDTDPPFYTKNPETGNDEMTQDLFPNVVFGNLLGG